MLEGRGGGIMRSPAIVKSVDCHNVAQRAGLGIFKYSRGLLKFLLPFRRGAFHRAAQASVE